MLIPRNSFIQMSKLSNVKGRINYISSHARQENLYAVYENVERSYWSQLAKCNQEQFKKMNQSGTCIEARELIIALPECFVSYDSKFVLKSFVDYFSEKCKTDCIAALHHNKKKTNYHIHLIFSERKKLEQPITKIATRNRFYNEKGEHERTKKSIVDESGDIRKGCKVIGKGEVYEEILFTPKNEEFKSKEFLDKVKIGFTNVINEFIEDDKEKLQVFEKDSIYLPTKKIGKNNPRASSIKLENTVRTSWNRTADRVLLSEIPEEKIMEIKKEEVHCKIRESIQIKGIQKGLLVSIILNAVTCLERMLQKHLDVLYADILEEKEIEKPMEKPVPSKLVVEYFTLQQKYNKLQEFNKRIFGHEKKKAYLEIELEDTNGVFKWRKRNELQEKIKEEIKQIEIVESQLLYTLHNWGYENAKEFISTYYKAGQESEDYDKAVVQWERKNGNPTAGMTIAEKLEYTSKENKKREKSEMQIDNYQRTTHKGRGR
ncbi:MAG: MobA/MobL family protein [Eubacteriales bacterium]